MIEKLFLTSRSDVQEDKKKWNPSPAGNWPSVIRRAEFHLGSFVCGGGGGGESIPKNFFEPRSGLNISKLVRSQDV